MDNYIPKPEDSIRYYDIGECMVGLLYDEEEHIFRAYIKHKEDKNINMTNKGDEIMEEKTLKDELMAIELEIKALKKRRDWILGELTAEDPQDYITLREMGALHRGNHYE